jgi:hypothetical protein
VPEALGHRARGQRGELAERADPEPLEHLGKRLQLGPGAKEGDGKRGEEVPGASGLNDDGIERVGRPAAPPPRTCLKRRRMRRETARRNAEAGARPERAAGGAQHSGEVAPVDAVEPGRGEEGRARVVRLHLGSDALEPVEHRAP